MAARDGIVIGKNNVVDGNVKNFALINCNDKHLVESDSGKTYINNGYVSSTLSTNASASSPTAITIQFGMYYCDASAGDVIINMGDTLILKDCRIVFKRMDNSNNKIIFNAFGAELLEFKAMPQNNLLKKQGDTILITSNGTDWFIL